MRMAVLNSGTAAVVPAAADWLAVSKTLAIEAAFLASVGDLLFLHGGQNALNLAFATGATLGVLRLSDILANVVNVRGIINSPTAQQAGIMPQPAGTPLIATPATITTGGPSNGTAHAS